MATTHVATFIYIHQSNSTIQMLLHLCPTSSRPFFCPLSSGIFSAHVTILPYALCDPWLTIGSAYLTHESSIFMELLCSFSCLHLLLSILSLAACSSWHLLLPLYLPPNACNNHMIFHSLLLACCTAQVKGQFS